MRILHTSDWHLGKTLHNAPLLDDQAHALRAFVEVVRSARPDVVVIAGDLYDRAIAPVEAVELMDGVLSEVVLGLKVPVVGIAGNHDSGTRLHFGSRLLRAAGLHLAGLTARDAASVTLADEHGPVRFVALPYAEPDVVATVFEAPELKDHAAALGHQLAGVRASRAEGERTVLIAHAFVSGGLTSDSERPLAIGAVDSVPAGLFERFDYVALGHLHRPQGVGPGRIQYSGSLLKYSFSEEKHVKSVTMVELARDACTVERIPLAPRRDVRTVTGRFQELLDRPLEPPLRDAYLWIELEDRDVLPDEKARLERVYPNVLAVSHASARTAPADRPRIPEGRSPDELEMFEAFHAYMLDAPADDESKTIFIETLNRVRAAEREAPVAKAVKRGRKARS